MAGPGDGQSTSRRRFLQGSLATSAGWLLVEGCAQRAARLGAGGALWQLVNDVHSQLNPTRVSAVERPADLDSLTELIHRASREAQPVSLCGGRHAGGGQQFLSDHVLVDLSDMSRLMHFDAHQGLIEVEAGCRWPSLIEQLRRLQMGRPDGSTEWGIHQKQGGADELSIGGAVASNVHGRHLASRPFVQDIEALRVIDAGGKLIRCSRAENTDRFRHIVGGYGLFGVVYSVTLRLAPRRKLVKHARWVGADDAIGMLEQQAAAGAIHGDFQYAVDESADSFLREGLLAWYEPAPRDALLRKRLTPGQAEAQFNQFIALAHRDKTAALAAYRSLILATDGEVDWSDTWQAGDYVPAYHKLIDPGHGSAPGAEILTEFYVPRAALPTFLSQAAKTLKQHHANIVYGTVRLIRRDEETALAWASQDYACVIFNLHTQQDPSSIAANAETFRALLDAAIALGGSYYLTYHRFARKDQTLKCYPQMPEFLAAKHRYDPREIFQSDWYRFYREMFSRGR